MRPDVTMDFFDRTETIARWCCGFQVDTSTLAAELRRWADRFEPNALDDDEAEAVLDAAADAAHQWVNNAEVDPADRVAAYRSRRVAALSDLGVVLTWEKPQARIEFLTREDEA